MGNKTLGRTFLDSFQSQTQQNLQPSNPTQSPVPLSTKTGINNQKKTALQQGVLQALVTPQMGAMQNGLS